MSKTFDELCAVIAGQQAGKENTDVYMVGEQLKDIGAESEHNAEILLQDITMDSMNLVAAAAQLKDYADKNHGKNKCFCISLKVADGILRKFYGLDEQEEKKIDTPTGNVQDGGFIDLTDFL